MFHSTVLNRTIHYIVFFFNFSHVCCFFLPKSLQVSRKPVLLGFLGSLGGKKSAFNAREPSLVPGSGRSPGEGVGYPFHYSWASLVAQLLQNLPAMWETSVRSLGWEDPLEKGTATYSSILAWRIPWTV